jgi:hypothetical protein
VVSPAIVNEDPRALAAVLTHELVHVKQGLQGLLKRRDCALLEADLTRNATLVRQKGVPGVYGRLHAGPETGRACVVW